MKLPNCEHAFIPLSKLDGYLLSETHPAGQSKAEFFRSVGFDKNTVGVLQAGLFAIAQEQEIMEIVSSPYGIKYVVDGVISTPTGQVVGIRTIWIIDTGLDIPRFVTAYPS